MTKPLSGKLALVTGGTGGEDAPVLFDVIGRKTG